MVVAWLALCPRIPQKIMTSGTLEANLNKCLICPVEPFTILVMSKKKASRTITSRHVCLILLFRHLVSVENVKKKNSKKKSHLF